MRPVRKINLHPGAVLAVLLAAVLLLPLAASASTITFDYKSGIQDTMVTNYRPNTPGGKWRGTWSYNLGRFQSQSLFRFDNLFGNGTGQIPLGSTIRKATLRLYLYGYRAYGNRSSTMSLYDMTRDWNESSATWNSLGGGVRPGMNAATQPTTSQTFYGPRNHGWVELAVAPSLQAWANGKPNYGWAVLPDVHFSAFQFITSNGSHKLRPTLSVDFVSAAATPEPGTLLLLASALGVGAWWRRRRAA